MNPWKLSTLVLAAVLGLGLVGPAPKAEAAGPLRLGKALAALKSAKKFLEEAKDPPAPQHAQSMTAVTQAIGALEREIKAYEAAAAKAKGATSAPAAPAPAPAPAKKKDEKSPKKADFTVEDLNSAMADTSFDVSKIDQLRELVDNDMAELGSLVNEYQTNSATLLQQLNDSLANQRVQELSRAAHTLKSSSALMGAAGLASSCERLEAASRKGQIPGDAAAQVAEIEARFSEACRWLQAQLAR